MNNDELVPLEGGSGFGSDARVSPVRINGFDPEGYNVRTGIDVAAVSPGAAMLAAIEEMGLRNPEAFCYRVEHLQSVRKWEVDLYPSGEIEVEDRDK